MKSFLILLILAGLLMTGISTQYNADTAYTTETADTTETAETTDTTDTADNNNESIMKEEDADLKTEVATIVEINNNVCVVATKSDEIYQIQNFSDFNLSVEEGEEIAFSYMDKKKTSDGKYDITVKWMDKWEKFNPENMVNGL